MGEDLVAALQFMRTRLKAGKPRTVSGVARKQWYIYSDASYEPSTKTGGLGAVLVDQSGDVTAWFGMPIGMEQGKALGSETKDTVIFELELLAAILAIALWCRDTAGDLHTWFGDNDASRYSLIKASAMSIVGKALLSFHLELETVLNTSLWFARVPTEANIADYPSRLCSHPLLEPKFEVTCSAEAVRASILKACC